MYKLGYLLAVAYVLAKVRLLAGFPLYVTKGQSTGVCGFSTAMLVFS